MARWASRIAAKPARRPRSAPGRSERIQQWKEEETRQRNLWTFVRKNAEAITGVKAPWPFDTDAGRKQVLDFVRAAFRPDEPKRSRLTPFDLAIHRETLAAAERGESWAWYGRAVYDLTRRYEILPEAADAKLMVVDFNDLPPGMAKFADRPIVKKRLTPHAGRWPDFALEFHDEVRQFKLPPGPLPAFGPARVSDFKDPVQTFWEKELAPKLYRPGEEWSTTAGESLAGVPARVHPARAGDHDLSVPGVMLPGSPKRWDATYGDPLRGFRGRDGSPPAPIVIPLHDAVVLGRRRGRRRISLFRSYSRRPFRRTHARSQTVSGSASSRSTFRKCSCSAVTGLMVPAARASSQFPYSFNASSSSGGKTAVEQPNANGRRCKNSR